MSEAKKPEPRVLPYVLAINEGIRTVLREQDDSFLAGEDVAAAGSVYGYCGGLLDEFGSRRVIDTPISEKGIMGLGVGASGSPALSKPGSLARSFAWHEGGYAIGCL